MQVSASGGENAPILTPFQHTRLYGISSDHAELLTGGFTGLEPEAPLWAIPVPAGTPRRLGDMLAHSATWSPDGQQIVYASGTDLYRANGDGTNARKLISLKGIPDFLQWSPSGRVLRFTLHDFKTNSSSLWEVSSEGADLHPLLASGDGTSGECCGAWTHDGKYFVFQSARNGVSNIWAIPEGGGPFRKKTGKPVILTAGPMNFLFPVPSRDGKKVFVIGEQARSELMRYDLKTRQFMPYLAGISAEGVTFSRDGLWVAYVAYPQGTLWRSKVDGSERLQLAVTTTQAFQPRWSPDGKRIAFMAIVPGRPWQIYIVSADGGNPEQVTRDEHNHGDPDGNSLVFGDVLTTGNDNATALHILDVRTHSVSKVSGSNGLFSPKWSPDGRYLAAQSSDGQKLVGFDFKTQIWADWAKLFMGYQNWSRDGKYLYFDGTIGGEAGLYRLRISDCKVELLASLKGLGRLAGTFGPWTGLALDDSPLVLRDVGTQEIYALEWDAP